MGQNTPTGCTFDFSNFETRHILILKIWKLGFLDFWVSFWYRGYRGVSGVSGAYRGRIGGVSGAYRGGIGHPRGYFFI